MNIKSYLLTILLLTFNGNSFAQDLNGRPVVISLGAGTSSKRVYRGAVTWPVYTYFPMASFLFYNTIRLAGPNIDLSIPLEFITLSAGGFYFNDDEPWIKFSSHKADYRNGRKSSVSIWSGLSMEFLPRHKISLKMTRGVRNQYGLVFNGSLKIPLIPLTSLSLGIDYGDNRANHYAYGDGSIKGVGHLNIGLGLFLPFLPGGGIIISNLNYSYIVKGANRQSDYVRGDYENFRWMALCTWNI